MSSSTHHHGLHRPLVQLHDAGAVAGGRRAGAGDDRGHGGGGGDDRHRDDGDGGGRGLRSIPCPW